MKNEIERNDALFDCEVGLPCIPVAVHDSSARTTPFRLVYASFKLYKTRTRITSLLKIEMFS